MNRRPSSQPARSQDPDAYAYSRSGNLNNYPPAFDDDYDPRPPRRPSRSGEYRDPGGYRDDEERQRPQRRPPSDRLERDPRSRRRSPRQSGSPSGRRRLSPTRRLRKPYRYGALACMMVFAGLGGMCVALSGIGGAGESLGLLLAAIPAFLLSLGSAALYVYF
jgi:hypothetical protein